MDLRWSSSRSRLVAIAAVLVSSAVMGALHPGAMNLAAPESSEPGEHEARIADRAHRREIAPWYAGVPSSQYDAHHEEPTRRHPELGERWLSRLSHPKTVDRALLHYNRSPDLRATPLAETLIRSHDRPGTREFAVWVVRVAPTRSALLTVAAALEDDDSGVRRAAQCVLRSLFPDGPERIDVRSKEGAYAALRQAWMGWLEDNAGLVLGVVRAQAHVLDSSRSRR